MNKRNSNSVIKKIKTFLKANKTLSICFGVALLYLILYLIFFKEFENNANISKLIDTFFQISIGYIINYIFYITQVYIPQNKLRENAKRCIKSNINKIISKADNMFSQLSNNLISKNINDFNDNDFLVILQNLDINRKVDVINPSKLYDTTHTKEAHFTAREWIKNEIQSINVLIDETLTYYANYITPEVLDIFNRMRDSSLNTSMVNTLLYLYSVSFKKLKEDIFFSPYYKMIAELKECLKQYD